MSEAPPTTKKPELHVLVYNVAKTNNVGNIIRSAVAFGATNVIGAYISTSLRLTKWIMSPLYLCLLGILSSIITYQLSLTFQHICLSPVVGDRKIQTFGNHNTTDYIKFTYYDKLSEAVEKIHEKGFKIVGVEIGDKAQDVTTHPFQGNTVLMFGNEGHGMDAKQLAVCDQLVYIPQYGKGTASLNVSNAGTLRSLIFSPPPPDSAPFLYELPFTITHHLVVLPIYPAYSCHRYASLRSVG